MKRLTVAVIGLRFGASHLKGVIENGANVIVAGSAVFKAENPESVIAALKGDL